MDPSFEKLLALLVEGKVRFVVVGGVAVTLNGFVRFAGDVDLLVDAAPDNVDQLLAALSKYGEGSAGQLSPADFTEEEGAVRIIEAIEQVQVDVHTVLCGKSYHDLLADAEWWDMGAQRFAYASRQALLQMKMDSLRGKDRVDALALRELLKDPRVFEGNPEEPAKTTGEIPVE